jgi:hypothetical protein
MALSDEDITRIKSHIGFVHFEFYARYRALLHLVGEKLEKQPETLEREVDAWIEARKRQLLDESRDRMKLFFRTGPWSQPSGPEVLPNL